MFGLRFLLVCSRWSIRKWHGDIRFLLAERDENLFAYHLYLTKVILSLKMQFYYRT